MSSDGEAQREFDGPLGSETTAPGGKFSDSGRRAAVAGALPLVGRYFQQSGSRTRLRSVQALHMSREQGDADARFIAALRLRAALATAELLLPLLEEVIRRPTFRYALRPTESIGELSGTLDLNRFVARPPVSGEPPSYPILDVRRTPETPENVMCAYALMRISDELRSSLDASGAGLGSPEFRAVDGYLERLAMLRTSPAMKENCAAARVVINRDHGASLLERVEERIRRGEVGNADPYAEVLSELCRLRDQGPSGSAGSALWSFYDDSFDWRLFELWCLHRLSVTISNALAVPTPAVSEGWIGGGLSFSWHRPMGSLSLYFQKSLTDIRSDYTAQWIRSNKRPLGGVPDFVVVVNTHNGEERVALLDAKLRQRPGPPTEELYKILGYFNNYQLLDCPRGAILYYTASNASGEPYVYHNESNSGTLIATALNPEDDAQVDAALRPVVDAILEMLGMSRSLPSAADGSTDVGEQTIHRRLAELEAVAVTLAPQTLEASKRRLRAALGDEAWFNLGEVDRRMLATAEHVGFFLAADADFSGPVLGLISPLESIIHRRVVVPAMEAHPQANRLRQSKMFGQVLGLLKDSIDGSPDAACAAVRDVLGIVLDDQALQLHPVLARLSDINVRFRRPAAHKEAMSEEQWLELYGQVIRSGGVLTDLLALLPAESESQSQAG